MGSIIVDGGHKLYGDITIHGAKNAVLPILAATILNKGENIIRNCPDLKDVRATIKILEHLGADIKRDGDTLAIAIRRQV